MQNSRVAGSYFSFIYRFENYRLITEFGVFKLLDKIDVSKASGPDCIPGRPDTPEPCTGTCSSFTFYF